MDLLEKLDQEDQLDTKVEEAKRVKEEILVKWEYEEKQAEV